MKSDSNSPYDLWPDPLPTLELSSEALKKIKKVIDNPPPPSPQLQAAIDRWIKRCKDSNL